MEYDEACLIVSHCLLIRATQETDSENMFGTLMALSLAQHGASPQDVLKVFEGCVRETAKFDDAITLIKLTHLEVTAKDRQ